MGAKARKKVGGLRATTGAVRSSFSGPTIRVGTLRTEPQWQVTFSTQEGAATEASQRAKAEAVRYYVLKFVHPREGTHYSAIDEEVFLMCGGHRGWGRPVQTFNAQGEDDAATSETPF